MITTQDNTVLFLALYNAITKAGVKLTSLYDGNPYVGTASYQGIDGHYFKRQLYGNWSDAETVAICKVFPFYHNDNVVNLHGFDDMESDDDRFWDASITFDVTNRYDILAQASKAQADYESGKRLY
tara:strand:- start:2293 stop:2670 length:378 start_codon:yes stop_codon:yes gene_type:complete